MGIDIANLVGGFVALVSGVILIYQFPLKFVLVTIITTIIGMLVGGLFGRLVDYPTLLMGYANGLMMGIMAPMVGAAAQRSMVFLLFLELILIFSFIFLVLHVKKPSLMQGRE